MASPFDFAVKAAAAVGNLSEYAQTAADLLGFSDPEFLLRQNDTERAGPGAWMGGQSLYRARELAESVSQMRLARKSIFMVSVIGPDIAPVELGLDRPGMAIERAFWMLATDVSYNGATLSGEVRRVGSGHFDSVTGRDPVEVSITAMDDDRGIIKRWYRALAARVAHHDGTVGVPADYVVQIEIRHGVADVDSPGYKLAYYDKLLVRPQSIQHDLSRSDRGIGTAQLQFVEFDSFMQPKVP